MRKPGRDVGISEGRRHSAAIVLVGGGGVFLEAGGVFMGQKVRPTGFRTGIMTDWLSKWYASKADFCELLVEDKKIRSFVKKKYGNSGISKIRIERTREKVTVFVYAARVGMIIGKKGAEIDKL